MALIEELVKDFQKATKAPESQRKESVATLCNDIVEGYRRGNLSVLKDVDFDKLLRDCVPKEALKNLASDSPALVEEGLDVIGSTDFPDLLSASITVGMMEFCEQAPMTVMNLVDNITVGCGQDHFYGYHPLGDIVDDECLAEKEMTPYKGVCPPNKISTGKRCKKKFAMGITREMLCYDVNNQIQNLMRTGAEVATLHNGKIMLRTMFGLHDTNRNPYPFIYDDVPYDAFYSLAGAPWLNRIVDNNLDGTFVPFDAIEVFSDKQRDPFTGEPTLCMFKDILVSSIDARDKALRGLNLMQVSFDLPASVASSWGANPRAEVSKPADTRFGNVIYDRYAKDQLVEFYKTVVGLNEADSLDAAANTWMAGDFRKAFAWAVEWPFETLERAGTDTREYFDQEIVYQIKFLWKAAPVVKAPWAVLQMVPDITGYASYSPGYTWA